MKPRKAIIRKKPLKRSSKPLKRTPLKKVSSKRQKDMRTYSALRKKHLSAHPYCQVTIRLLGLNEQDVIAEQGWYKDVWGRTVKCPLAEDIHHRAGRGANYLDENTWLAVCREKHVWIHHHASEARKMNLLD